MGMYAGERVYAQGTEVHPGAYGALERVCAQ